MKSFSQMLRSALAVLVIALACQWAALAQAVDSAAIDKLMQNAMKEWQVPGTALAIVRGNEVVYLTGYGVKKIGAAEPVTPDTLFAIGSTTKAFTTTAMAMLVDEGKMKWDDPVRQHVEFFRLADPLANEYVTMRDLVCHRTGLSRHDLLWYGSPWSREEIMRKIGLVKLTQPFRSTYQYQNIMFLTAGHAVGVISRSTWEDFIQQRIFNPLGMTGANFSTKDAERAPDHSTPHTRKEGKIIAIPWRNIDNIAPAGSINAGVRDLSKWVRFQLGDGTFEGKRLVSAANLAETHTPQMVIRVEADSAKDTETTQASYGLGWSLQDYRGHLLVSHGGGIDGYLTNITLVPKAKIGIVILSNLSPSPLPTAVGRGLIDLLLGLPPKDWIAIANEQLKKAEAAQKKREQEREAKRHQNTKPTRELAAYAGAYEEPAYGTATISAEGGALAIQWSNFKSRLEHYHFDTFTAKDDRLENETVIFTLGADGEVATMRALGVEFKKVKPKTPAPITGR
jgi:CubicO group peptidase (beta-lactamase class C family)